MDLGINGKRAVVCGASKGIGRAVAERLAREGASLTLVARTASDLEAAARDIAAETGARIGTVAADLTSPEDRARVLAHCPIPDILIAHPGIPQRPIAYQNLTGDDWQWWMEAHFHAAMDLIQGYAPGMAERGFGRIVNISVSFIKFPQPNVGHSHGPRLALAGAIASLAREVAARNVTINSVLPGLINTEALRDALKARADARGVPYETIVAEVVRTCPAGRIAEPEEIADLVAMLAAGQMGFMTAQNIVSDGGAYPGLF
ncbi:MAG: SDR family oxidoreductase [Sphingomonadales bacterium]